MKSHRVMQLLLRILITLKGLLTTMVYVHVIQNNALHLDRHWFFFSSFQLIPDVPVQHFCTWLPFIDSLFIGDFKTEEGIKVQKGKGGACSVVGNSLWPPWTIACQDPLSPEFSLQEYWGGLSFTLLGDLPDLGIKPTSPTLAGRLFTTELPRKPHSKEKQVVKHQLFKSSRVSWKKRNFRDGAACLFI